MATIPKISVTPITSAVGAIIVGVDTANSLGDYEVELIEHALLEHGVVFFRDQVLSDAQMGAFVSRFGTPTCEPFGSAMQAEQDPVATSDFGRSKQSTSMWHTDTTFVPEPPGLTALRAVEPPAWGGDTCWSSMYAAYEALSQPMQTFIDGLTAAHSLLPTLQRMGPQVGSDRSRDAQVLALHHVHPLVRVHPRNGRKALYFSEACVTNIPELTQAESDHLVSLLREHCKSPDFAMRWHWTANDLALWDNRIVQHYAVPDYAGKRVMQRVITAGERPIAVPDRHKNQA